MKLPVFTGSGVALVTPFFGETVDLSALGKLLDWQIESGTDAIIVCGTTGEASTMSYRERMRVIEFSVDRVNGRVPVIAGTGSNSTENAIALSRDAQFAGANALLVVTPYYNKATQEGLTRHYRLIADSVAKPVILYNVPSRTGVNIAPQTYAALAEHPNINGVKEANGDLNRLQITRNLCPQDFHIWSGNDDETALICLLGGVGVISVAANLIPDRMHALVQSCLNGDFTSAGKQQLALKSLMDALFCEVNPIPVKTALNLMGRPVGGLRLPLCEISESNKERLRQTLQSYHLLAESP